MADAGESGRRTRRSSVLARAVALLSRREHSASELRRKLVERGFEPAEVDATLQRLQGNGLQDDARFAEALARSRANRGRGPLQLRAELARHGLAEGLAAEAIEQAESDQDWVSRALELAQRRLRGADPKDPREQRRLADFLLRRGFPSSVVRSVLARIGSELELEDPGP